MSTVPLASRLALRQSRSATRTVYRLAAAAATLTVAMGAINSATGSGFACPTWPGCYPGQFGPEAEVHATDLNPAMLDVAAERTSAPGRVTTVPADAQQLPFGAGEFDLAVCQFGISSPQCGLTAILPSVMNIELPR